MKKAIVIIVLILLVVWIAFSVVAHNQASQEPSAAQAPYMIQTSSRVFYAQQVSGKPPFVTVTGYWERHSNDFIYYRGQLAFNDKTGKISVIRR